MIYNIYSILCIMLQVEDGEELFILFLPSQARPRATGRAVSFNPIPPPKRAPEPLEEVFVHPFPPAARSSGDAPAIACARAGGGHGRAAAKGDPASGASSSEPTSTGAGWSRADRQEVLGPRGPRRRTIARRAVRGLNWYAGSRLDALPRGRRAR